jgi:hypothetical protein
LKLFTAEQCGKKLFNAGFHVSMCKDIIEIVHGRAVHKESTQIVRSSNEGGHKNRNLNTMTRSAEELSRDEHIDLKVLVEYIKNHLFPKAKLVLGMDEWEVGGMIYNNFIKCCNGRIGLKTIMEVVRERYMEKIWMRALNKKLQKKALVQKRSTIYTVMQNKFTGNLHNRGAGFEE